MLSQRGWSHGVTVAQAAELVSSMERAEEGSPAVLMVFVIRDAHWSPVWMGGRGAEEKRLLWASSFGEKAFQMKGPSPPPLPPQPPPPPPPPRPPPPPPPLPPLVPLPPPARPAAMEWPHIPGVEILKGALVSRLCATLALTARHRVHQHLTIVIENGRSSFSSKKQPTKDRHGEPTQTCTHAHTHTHSCTHTCMHLAHIL